MHEGGAKSNIWRQIITDVFNVPTVLTKRKTGAPFGDAILAGVATGYFRDYAMCKQLAEYVNMLEPIEKNHKKYMQYFELYKEIYMHIKQDYRKLARLRDMD
jgi:xylulokinase